MRIMWQGPNWETWVGKVDQAGTQTSDLHFAGSGALTTEPPGRSIVLAYYPCGWLSIVMDTTWLGTGCDCMSTLPLSPHCLWLGSWSLTGTIRATGLGRVTSLAATMMRIMWQGPNWETWVGKVDQAGTWTSDLHFANSGALTTESLGRSVVLAYYPCGWFSIVMDTTQLGTGCDCMSTGWCCGHCTSVTLCKSENSCKRMAKVM